MADIFKELEEVLTQTTKTIEEGVNKLGERLDYEAKKIDLKAQIGNHERVIRQNYTKLGEAYYSYRANNTSMDQTDSIVEAIKANLKVVELLSEQLKALDSTTKAE